MNEEFYSKLRAIALWERKSVFEVGSWRGISAIHYWLFQDVFDFAGKLRTMNLAKGNFRFAPVLFLEENLKQVEQMPQETFDEIIKKYVEMNVLHPFLEGNGRAMRIWLDEMLKASLGRCIDWTKVPKKRYLEAMERSPIDCFALEVLLENALTEKIHDQMLYLKGIQVSYAYEGFDKIDIFDFVHKKSL